MLIRNTKEFLEKTKTRKILGLDMGKKRIGLAISDPSHKIVNPLEVLKKNKNCLLYTSPSPRDRTRSRMPSSA